MEGRSTNIIKALVQLCLVPIILLSHELLSLFAKKTGIYRMSTLCLSIHALQWRTCALQSEHPGFKSHLYSITLGKL